MPDHITSIYPLSTIHLYSIAYSLVDFNLFIINSLFLSISTPLSRLDSYSAEPYHLSVFFAQSLTGDWTTLVRAPGPTKRCTQRPPLSPGSSHSSTQDLCDNVTIFSVGLFRHSSGLCESLDPPRGAPRTMNVVCVRVR